MMDLEQLLLCGQRYKGRELTDDELWELFYITSLITEEEYEEGK